MAESIRLAKLPDIKHLVKNKLLIPWVDDQIIHDVPPFASQMGWRDTGANREANSNRKR
jgi:hypothetical protein